MRSSPYSSGARAARCRPIFGSFTSAAVGPRYSEAATRSSRPTTCARLPSFKPATRATIGRRSRRAAGGRLPVVAGYTETVRAPHSASTDRRRVTSHIRAQHPADKASEARPEILSPPRRFSSPRRTRSSPPRPSLSPRRTPSSPRRRLPSPPRPRPSPRRKASSPRRTPSSPPRRLASPPRPSLSPRRTPSSPRSPLSSPPRPLSAPPLSPLPSPRPPFSPFTPRPRSPTPPG